MYRSFKSNYAVKTSSQKYASIIATHRSLGEAYKTMMRHHRAYYKNHEFILSQPVLVIIATELPKETILIDIAFWRDLDMGPRSKKRLPLPIVVHQWQHNFNMYQRYGENS